MTSEERLDRLERIARLMVRAGLRARRQMRDQDEKINMIIDAQMKSEERLRTDEEKIGLLIDAQLRNEKRFANLIETQTQLTESHIKQTADLIH
jgi:hypothetical protein